MEKKNNINETGVVKRNNKAMKNLKLIGVKPEEKGNPDWRPKPGAPESDRVKAHKAKRGIKKSAMFAEAIKTIFQRAEMDAKKPLKKKDKKKDISKDMDPKTGKPYGSGAEQLSKMKESFRNAIDKILNEEDTTDDTIKNAGGDPSIYQKIKKQKEIEKELDTKPTYYHDGSSKRPRRDLKAGPKGHSRFNTFERPKTNNTGKENFKKGKAIKPMPLKPKGNPGEGKDASASRGKTINTSRSTGQEDMKAQKNSDAFNKLMQNIMKRKGTN